MRRHALSLLVLGFLAILALGSVDSEKSSRAPDSSPALPSASSRPEARPPTVEETQRMNRAMATARDKLDTVVSTLGMSGDFVITDTADMRDGQVTVNLSILLVSEDAVDAYANHKLQQNTYPGFKRIYRDAMHDEGFSSVSVYIFTNPFKH